MTVVLLNLGVARQAADRIVSSVRLLVGDLTHLIRGRALVVLGPLLGFARFPGNWLVRLFRTCPLRAPVRFRGRAVSRSSDGRSGVHISACSTIFLQGRIAPTLRPGRDGGAKERAASFVNV